MLKTSVSAPHILNEIEPPPPLMLWGEPGCEALLGQLLPRSRSLFLSYYEVPQARREFRRMQALIEAQGVEVVRAKDAFVSRLKSMQLPGLPSSLRELEQRLMRKAEEYFETYRQIKVSELVEDGAGALVEDVYDEVRNDIPVLLQEDADLYGAEAAVKLNHVLSLSHPLPISNIFYGRDQSSALGDRILLSSLFWEIRKPEVEIYRQALLELGLDGALVQAAAGTVEGGDIILYGDTCYVGVGARTSLDGVKDLYARLGPRLEAYGIRLVAVVNERQAREARYLRAPAEEHMRTMHLDMFWIPLGPDLVMAYGPEVDARRVLGFARQDGRIVTEPLGSFRDLLAASGCEVLEVTMQEQHDYATNLLNLGNRRVIVSLSKNERVIAALQERGYHVLQAELNKLVGGYGAIHCLAAPLVRQ